MEWFASTFPEFICISCRLLQSAPLMVPPKFEEIFVILYSVDRNNIAAAVAAAAINQEGKTNLDLLEQGIVSSSGISWAICKFAPHSRQITMLSLIHI